MAREQHVVDFLGIGISKSSTEREDLLKDRQGKHNLGSTLPAASKTLPSHLLRDVNSSLLVRPSVAIGQSAQNSMVLLSKNELPRLLSHDNNHGNNNGPSAVSLSPNTLHTSMSFKGTKYPSWNTNINMQHVLPVRKFQEEMCIIENGQNLSEKLLPYSLNPYQLQDLINSNRGKALCSQSFALGHNTLGDHSDSGKMQMRNYLTSGNLDADGHVLVPARQYQNAPLTFSTTAPEEHGSTSYFSSDYVGTLPKSVFSLSASNFKDKALAVPALGTQQDAVANSSLSRMLSSDRSGKQNSAQLTIFYAGNVNVYDDISVDKARDIMLLAGGCSLWPQQGYNSVARQCTPFGLLNAGISHSSPGSPQHGHDVSFNLQERMQPNVQACQASSQPAARQVSKSPVPVNKQLESSKPVTPTASSSLLGGQTVVPRPLPQARKASLARFLEKRRERVQTKSPYPIKEQSLLPGERFSSSNYDAASPTGQDECVDKKPMSMSCDMEEMTGTFEYTSTCDIVAKEEKRLSAAGTQVSKVDMAV